jgi:hypothetical protein
MSLILQLDYSSSSGGKSMRPLFEQQDPLKEGKIPLETFKAIIANNTNGKGIDLWVTDVQIKALIEYLDPSVGDSSHRQREGFKIDYTALLFQLEKPVSFQFAKLTKLPSLTFYHALLAAIDTYLREVAPGRIEDFLAKNSNSMGFSSLPAPSTPG